MFGLAVQIMFEIPSQVLWPDITGEVGNAVSRVRARLRHRVVGKNDGHASVLREMHVIGELDVPVAIGASILLLMGSMLPDKPRHSKQPRD